MEPNILLVTKGHPFDRNSFFGMFDELPLNYTHVEQPAARVFFSPELSTDYDALVMYDMPGIQFSPGGPDFETPSQQYIDNLNALCDAGQGLVFLHHAIAGWPAWEEYAEILGGRFLYMSGELRGRQRPDSGYRHKVNHTISTLTDHPVLEGIPSSFSMVDELYLFEVFDDDVVPLLGSDHGFTRDNFYSATHAVRDGKMFDNEGWTHPDGSNLVGWVKRYRNSPIVYLQGGDDPEAYASPEYRQLIVNAVNWVKSTEAKAWARSAT